MRNKNKCVLTLPDIAAEIARIFPEFEGRAVAVSDAEIDPEQLPILPLALVGLMNDTAEEHVWNNGQNGELWLQENIRIEILLKPVIKTNNSGNETTFWSFYDYRSIRDRLLSGLLKNFGMEYVSMDIGADKSNVALSFRMRYHYKWQPLEDEDEDVTIINSKTINVIRSC